MRNHGTAIGLRDDAAIQGCASNAMAAMVGAPSEAREAAIIRLLALMESDGHIAPLLAIWIGEGPARDRLAAKV